MVVVGVVSQQKKARRKGPRLKSYPANRDVFPLVSCCADVPTNSGRHRRQVAMYPSINSHGLIILVEMGMVIMRTRIVIVMKLAVVAMTTLVRNVITL